MTVKTGAQMGAFGMVHSLIFASDSLMCYPVLVVVPRNRVDGTVKLPQLDCCMLGCTL